jgi:GNAT superfamily N-acetyltransferase
MNLDNLSITQIDSEDLHQVATVIAQAINSWPAPNRLKRNVLPVLTYREQDLKDHEILLVRERGRPVAMAAWQTEARLPDPEQQTSTLLHGLFVIDDAQATGLGRWLQATVARRALAAGFHGLHVKAERFARNYFALCGYRQLAPEEQPGAAESAYPYWFWQKCSELSTAASNPRQPARQL